MVVELVLAVVTTVESCIKLGRKALEVYHAYRNVDDDLHEKFKTIEGLWVKLEIQLDFLGKISSQLDARLATSQLDLLQILYGKLVSFDSQIDLSESLCLRKLKHAWIKKKLDELLADIETWQRRFDPSWFIITLVGNKLIDVEGDKQLSLPRSADNPVYNILALRQAKQRGQTELRAPADGQIKLSINLNELGLVGATKTQISFSSAQFVTRKHSPKSLIVETIESSGNDPVNTNRIAESLARRLKYVDAESFRILRCYGLLKHRDSTGRVNKWDIIYLAPSISDAPSSLRHLLLSREPPSASLVMRIAKQLVHSVSYVHSCDFVHKNIRPDVILVYPDGSSYLIGFNQLRDVCFQTNLKGDPRWHLNLYRHPQRQGVLVENRYIMQHDIYSLGVCLLEIGLWKSFVWYSSESPEAAPVPGLALGKTMSDVDFTSVGSVLALQTKEHLVQLARKQLLPRLGDIYTGIVLDCLTCLDPDNSAFSDAQIEEDEDGISIGVQYVEKVLSRMANISI